MESAYPTLLDHVFLLRRDDVLALLDISTATLARWVKEGRFPKAHRIGAGTNYWLASEVREWFIEHFSPMGPLRPPIADEHAVQEPSGSA